MYFLIVDAFQAIASACGTPMSVGLNTSEMASLVTLHNQLRSRVANGKETRVTTYRLNHNWHII